MEQPSVRLYAAGVAAASLLIFTAALSYGLAERSRTAGASAAAPAPAVVQTTRPPLSRQVAQAPAPAPRQSTDAKAPVQTPSKAAEKPASQPAAPSGATHVVRDGETLSEIARLYRVDLATIRSANNLKSDLIRVNQSLTIPGAAPMRRHVVDQGDSLWELAIRYGVSLEELLAANRKVDPGHLQIGQELVIPPLSSRAQLASPGPQVEPALAGLFAWPSTARVSSLFGPRWGRNHNGIDLAANMGDPIRAARDGEVLIAGTVPGYGYTVVLQHSDGTRTLYAHASKLHVSSGQKVKQGEVIARVGSTGNSTGPHLHFEIIVNDRPRDPTLYLPKR